MAMYVAVLSGWAFIFILTRNSVMEFLSEMSLAPMWAGYWEIPEPLSELDGGWSSPPREAVRPLREVLGVALSRAKIEKLWVSARSYARRVEDELLACDADWDEVEMEVCMRDLQGINYIICRLKRQVVANRRAALAG